MRKKRQSKARASGRGRPVEGLITSLDQGTREADAAYRRVGGTPAARLTWLLAFGPLRKRSHAKESERRRRATSLELYAFCIGQRGSMRRSRATTLAGGEFEELASKITQALRDLAAGRPWELKAADTPDLTRRLLLRGDISRIGLTLPVLLRAGISREDATGLSRGATSIYDGPLPQMFLWSVADFIAVDGSLLATCAYKKCGKLMVHIGDRRPREYCSKRCSLLERTRRYRSTHSKEQLSAVRHELYRRAVEREHGRTVAKRVRRRLHEQNSSPVIFELEE